MVQDQRIKTQNKRERASWSQIKKLKDYIDSREDNIECTIDEVQINNESSELTISPIPFDITKKIEIESKLETNNESKLEKLINIKGISLDNISEELENSIVDVYFTIESGEIIIYDIEGIYKNTNKNSDQDFTIIQLLEYFIIASGCLSLITFLILFVSFLFYIFIYIISLYPELLISLI